jgi:hypothetical protein
MARGLETFSPEKTVALPSFHRVAGRPCAPTQSVPSRVDHSEETKPVPGGMGRRVKPPPW